MSEEPLIAPCDWCHEEIVVSDEPMPRARGGLAVVHNGSRVHLIIYGKNRKRKQCDLGDQTNSNELDQLEQCDQSSVDEEQSDGN